VAHTAYSNLSISELIKFATPKRDYSPLIDELCTRLEGVDTTSPTVVACPICETGLTLKLDKDWGIRKLVPVAPVDAPCYPLWQNIPEACWAELYISIIMLCILCCRLAVANFPRIPDSSAGVSTL